MTKNTGITTFLGNPMTLLGNMIKPGDIAPDFIAVKPDLTPFKLSDIKDKAIVISIVPSIDTGVCDLQTRRFNKEAADLKNVAFISISCDLPFALGRYCATADIENITTLSDYKDTDFGTKYGFLIEELRLLNRGIIVMDKNHKVLYVEYVKENSHHPDYERALAEIKKIA